VKTYSLDDFKAVPSIKQQVQESIDFDDLPTIESVKTLANWNPELLELFDREPGDGLDRSAGMSRVAYFGAELGWDDEQIMSVLIDVDDRWGKYVGRSDREKRLVEFINRARQKYGYTKPTELTFGGLLGKKKGPSEAPVESPRQLVWGYQDFLESEFHIEWMLQGLLAVGGLGFVTGYPGTGKTQFCLQMAHHMALGYNKFLKWDNADGPRKVMFLSLEMGPNPLHLFMSTIAPAYSDMATLQRNFMVVPVGESLPLDTKEGQALLNNLLDEYMPDLLLIDSMQTVLSSDLSDEAPVKALFQYLSTVRQKYGTSMVIVHHNRKKSNEAQKKEIDINDVYGSTFITAYGDFVLSLRTVNKSLLSVDVLKNRLGPPISAFEIYRDEHLTFDLEFANLQERFGQDGNPDLTGISTAV
jgi:archaellum biogenesis ATPase FlaH